MNTPIGKINELPIHFKEGSNEKALIKYENNDDYLCFWRCRPKQTPQHSFVAQFEPRARTSGNDSWALSPQRNLVTRFVQAFMAKL